MLLSVDIREFRCLVNPGLLRLTPLHALVGPNDSGKSATLEAILAPKDFYGLRLSFDASFSHADWSIVLHDKKIVAAPPATERWLQGLRRISFRADMLRAPSELLVEGSTLEFRSPQGNGLPAVLDALRNRNDDAWTRIAAEMQSLFPAVAQLTLINTSSSAKQVAVTLKGGQRVSAADLSDGLLLYLAFCTLREAKHEGMLLIEEPENGLHPSRIADVMRVLRHLTERGTQVLLTTHSPLVVNELRPDEVTVVTRDASGSHFMRIDETPNFAARSDAYRLGELWLAYCDGVGESPLLRGGPRL